MSKPVRFALLGALFMLAVAMATACGDDSADGGAAATATESADHEDPATTISVELADFTVAPDRSSVAHGEITFAAQNVGIPPHNLVVIRTELTPDALPVEGAAVDESQLDVVLRTDDIPGGQSTAATVELEPGSYVLICNVPGHYALGMTSAFTLE